MANQITLIRQGESFSFIFDLDGEETTGWTCTIYVKEYLTDTSLITRVIEADGTGLSWSGYLTGTETASLPVGTYRLIGLLENSSTDQESQVPKRFKVGEAWAS